MWCRRVIPTYFLALRRTGELRLYGTIGRGKHQQDALGDGYLYSRDCGLSWHPHLGTGIASENGCGVRSPISGRYLHCYHSAALIYEDGPVEKTCREVKIFPPEEDTDEISPDIFPEAFDENGKRKNRNKMYGLPKHPIFLESKPGRCVIPFTRDTADSNFRPVVAISDDDGDIGNILSYRFGKTRRFFTPTKDIVGGISAVSPRCASWQMVHCICFLVPQPIFSMSIFPMITEIPGWGAEKNR